MKQISKNHLLLITSNSDVRQSIMEPLKKEGFRMLLAETGQAGLRTMQDYLVDAVILDYASPFARHDSTTSKSKALQAITDANPFLPLVLICENIAELSHSTSLMADMILVHPLEPAALLDALETVLHETLRERARRKAGSIAILR